MKFLKYSAKYLEENRYKLSQKTVLTYHTTIKSFSHTYPTLDLNSFTRSDIMQYLGHCTKAMARKHLINLKAMFTYALKEKLIKFNPTEGIKIPKMVRRVPLFLAKEEWTLLSSCFLNKDTADICTVAVYTGLRLNELINLKPADISNGTIIITSLKSGSVRSIPLNETAYRIIAERNKDRFVFTYKGYKWKERRIQVNFKKAVRKSGLNPKLHFHCLRHTFATWLVQANVPIRFIQELLGHESISTTLIYSHFNNQNLRDSVALL